MENHPVKQNCLVRFGWYYNRKPICDDSSRVLGVVLESPQWKECQYEKLSYQKGRWCIIEKTEITLCACVYTLDGEFEYYPLYNLVKLEE